MRRGISSHLVFSQRLTPALLGQLAATGADTIEVYAGRHHFDYTDRGAVRELANWFRSQPVAATMRMPQFLTEGDEHAGGEWTRYTQPTLNLIAVSKNDRIAAQDEMKRALESAEQVPFTRCVVQLGLRDDAWGTRAIDDSLTAIEHLKAFATPLGVQLLLENLPNDVSTPEHLAEICRVGHFDDVGFCLDLGHAHMLMPEPETRHAPARDGVQQALDAFGDRIAELHVHDNSGMRDEHLWPGDGKLDWGRVREQVSRVGADVPAVLEIAYQLATPESAWRQRAEAAWQQLGLDAR